MKKKFIYFSKAIPVSVKIKSHNNFIFYKNYEDFF